MKTIVLYYGGDLDESIAISWLAAKQRAEIVTVSMDLGGHAALDDVRDRAQALGAVRAHVLDLREAFASEALLPALQAGALLDTRGRLSAALRWPMVAKHLIAMARLEAAAAIAHVVSGPDHDVLETAIRSVDPVMSVLAPAQTWKLTASEKIEYARARGIPVPASGEIPPPADAEARSARVTAPVATVDITFAAGRPTDINGISMSLVELIESLNTMASAHGLHGRDVTGTPALDVLSAAYRALQQRVTPHDVFSLTPDLAAACADLAARGLWFSAAREALSAAVAKIQADVTGTVRVTLGQGRMDITTNGAMRQWGNEAMGNEAMGNEAMGNEAMPMTNDPMANAMPNGQ